MLSRRRFIEGTGLLAGAMMLVPRAAAAEAPPTPPAPGPATPVAKTPREVTLKAIGWNIVTRRFIAPPVWTWEPFPGAAGYVVMVAGEGDARARTIRLAEPRYDMTKDWANFALGWICLIAWAVDAEGRALCAAWPDAAGGRQFCKSPGFDRAAQAPLDWLASVERGMAYNLAPARDRVYPFEGDMPRSAWSSCEESITGQRRLISFPALHYPSFIFSYLRFGKEFSGNSLAPLALRQAKQYADWLLVHRQPAEARCSLFPYSTIENGRFEGYIEGKSITLFRAARVGAGMVDMFLYSGDGRYLAYARHLADVLVGLQRPDGSWPYRVNPKDGSVVADYTSSAITCARLLGMLEEIEPSPAYAAAREKAARWMLANPVQTRRWEGMFEDIAVTEPFHDLEHHDTNEMISYLIHYHRDDARLVAVAEELNRYIEDQFVIWQPGDRIIPTQVPTPMVAEQYGAFHAMEVHTGLWAQSLIALHRATGKPEYLTKAINACNAIVRCQQENGSYSTWGFDRRFGRPLLTIDWPGCHAQAMLALMRMNHYLRSLPGSRNEREPI